MMLCDFSKFAGTELPVIEGESHSYKTRGKNVRKKGRTHYETKLRNQRRSTASRVLDEGYNSDNSLLLANGDLKLDIKPYLSHYLDSGYQTMPDGRGWHSSEKNDDRRTRMGWLSDLETKKRKQKRSRSALKAVQNALWYRRVDPLTHSDTPYYRGNKYKDRAKYGPGEG